jgi:hypothetical protein
MPSHNSLDGGRCTFTVHHSPSSLKRMVGRLLRLRGVLAGFFI